MPATSGQALSVDLHVNWWIVLGVLALWVYVAFVRRKS